MEGMNISNPRRQKALLLHYAGPAVQDTYDTIAADTNSDEPGQQHGAGQRPPAQLQQGQGPPAQPQQGQGPPAQPQQGQEQGNIYQTAVKILTDYFNPKSSRQYSIYEFRQMTQSLNETLHEYHTRLRKQAPLCEFHSEDAEIKSQLILGCRNNKLRRETLEDEDLTLQKLLEKGRAREVSNLQAQAMEKPTQSHVQQAEVNAVRTPPRYKQEGTTTPHRRTSNNTRPSNSTCGLYGGRYPHNGGRQACPAYGKTCNSCGRQNHFAKVC